MKSTDVDERANAWLKSHKVDQSVKDEIKKLQDQSDNTEYIDCFYRELEFGTGGLRGIMGVGSNRMNKYTVGMATQGLANYLKKSFDEEVKVAIAHDSRNKSPFFAETTAAVFAANGIRVYMFDALRPTPELSYAVRQLGCKGGVVITASHNPKEYNGYKAYWSDGAQLIPPHDKNVIDEVKKIQSIDDVQFDGDSFLIETIGPELDNDYLEMIHGLSLSRESVIAQKDLKIVFSSIHGTGITLVPPILKKFGFENVFAVEEQAAPDGNFPTVVYPNPEEAEALTLALKKAKEIDADLVMATDPDADRVGIAVKNTKNEWQLLNGNQTGSLLIYYLLTKWKENGKLDGSQYIVKTIVTSDLIEKIADKFGVKCYNTLTGFKYIAEMIRLLEGKEEFIGGGEESYGYLIGDEVRDKDAIASCAMIAEMTAWSKNKGKSLFELLIDINAEFGLYEEGLRSITRKGKSGAEEIAQMMSNFRKQPPATLIGAKVVTSLDYQSSLETDLISGKQSPISLPKSNVLQFLTDKGDKISIRPSGTEPKIKFYFSVRAKFAELDKYYQQIDQQKERINQLVKELE